MFWDLSFLCQTNVKTCPSLCLSIFLSIWLLIYLFLNTGNSWGIKKSEFFPDDILLAEEQGCSSWREWRLFFHGDEALKPTKVTAVTDLGSGFKGGEIFVSFYRRDTEDIVLTYRGSWWWSEGEPLSSLMLILPHLLNLSSSWCSRTAGSVPITVKILMKKKSVVYIQ